jgi:hypothetical protein
MVFSRAAEVEPGGRTMETTGKANKTSSAFRMECGVAINIQAPPKAIWDLLTNSADYPRWNTTVKSLEGKMAVGEKLKLCVTAAPDRTFSPTVSELTPEKHMVWTDGMAAMFKGVRTYTLEPRPDGSTNFSMVEVFSGAMLPMIKSSLPDFGPPFEQYAADLKREGERKA